MKKIQTIQTCDLVFIFCQTITLTSPQESKPQQLLLHHLSLSLSKITEPEAQNAFTFDFWGDPGLSYIRR